MLLEAHGITYAYGAGKPALTDVQLHVSSGEIHGLIGPNGSGKSTLMKLMSNLLHSKKGNIQVCGREHQSLAARTSLMYLASNDYLPEFLTGLEYLRFIHSLYREKVAETAVAEYFKRYQMTGRQHDLMEDYSHGMRKKTQLIAALLLRRPLTLIDETLNGIDIDAIYTFERDIRALRNEGCGILLCSHDFTLLERCADRITFLHRGVVLEDDSTEALLERYGTLDAMVRKTVDEIEGDL